MYHAWTCFASQNILESGRRMRKLLEGIAQVDPDRAADCVVPPCWKILVLQYILKYINIYQNNIKYVDTTGIGNLHFSATWWDSGDSNLIFIIDGWQSRIHCPLWARSRDFKHCRGRVKFFNVASACPDVGFTPFSSIFSIAAPCLLYIASIVWWLLFWGGLTSVQIVSDDQQKAKDLEIFSFKTKHVHGAPACLVQLS